MKKLFLTRLTAVLVMAIMVLITCVMTNVYGKEKDVLEKSSIGEKIDGYIKMYEAGLASCEVSVFDRNGMIHNGYYGYSDIENQVPADETTVYEWGSCSKILVWVSVMQLWGQGKLDLDADIRHYLPEGFLTKLQYPEEKITMTNLMNHNAGFQESFYENQQATEEMLFENLEEAVKKCECYQAYHVGEHTAYSNWGTALAAYVVECISGEDYVSFVNQHIFVPLGMKHTSIDPHMADNAYVKEQRSKLKCYYRGQDRKDDEDYGECISRVQLYPCGCAVGTLEDFAKFGMSFISEECSLFEHSKTTSRIQK